MYSIKSLAFISILNSNSPRHYNTKYDKIITA